jgi:23S rRNA pseudouridine1911/1915/1917 synthase
MIKDEVNKTAIFTDSKKGKKSVLRFKVLDNIDEQSLIDIELETGRFHQIRAQLAKFGHPIYNDGKYGEYDKGFGLGLFAYEISFNHPTLKNRVKYQLMPKTGIFSKFQQSINSLEANK